MGVRAATVAVVTCGVVVCAPPAQANTLDDVLTWYDRESEVFFDALDGSAYRFLAGGETELGDVSLAGSRDPSGAASMTIKSPFLSGKLRCIKDDRCWFRASGERAWQKLAAGDVTVNDEALEISGRQIRKTLADATVASFDPSAGRAVLEASDGAQVAIRVTDSLISFVTTASKEGATEESVVEMRLRKDFRVKAPAKKLRSTAEMSYSFTIPGVPREQ